MTGTCRSRNVRSGAEFLPVRCCPYFHLSLDSIAFCIFVLSYSLPKQISSTNWSCFLAALCIPSTETQYTVGDECMGTTPNADALTKRRPPRNIEQPILRRRSIGMHNGESESRKGNPSHVSREIHGGVVLCPVRVKWRNRHDSNDR